MGEALSFEAYQQNAEQLAEMRQLVQGSGMLVAGYLASEIALQRAAQPDLAAMDEEVLRAGSRALALKQHFAGTNLTDRTEKIAVQNAILIGAAAHLAARGIDDERAQRIMAGSARIRRPAAEVTHVDAETATNWYLATSEVGTNVGGADVTRLLVAHPQLPAVSLWVSLARHHKNDDLEATERGFVMLRKPEVGHTADETLPVTAAGPLLGLMQLGAAEFKFVESDARELEAALARLPIAEGNALQAGCIQVRQDALATLGNLIEKPLDLAKMFASVSDADPRYTLLRLLLRTDGGPRRGLEHAAARHTKLLQSRDTSTVAVRYVGTGYSNGRYEVAEVPAATTVDNSRPLMDIARDDPESRVAERAVVVGAEDWLTSQ